MSDLPVSLVWGILDRDALAAEIVLEIVDDLQLLLDREPTDDRLKYRANSDMMFANKAAVVDVDKHAHQKSASKGSFVIRIRSSTMKNSEIYLLAIHSIGHSAVSWNAVAKVFDIESTLETRSEEATERSDQRSKARHKQEMELIRRIRDRVELSRELVTHIVSGGSSRRRKKRGRRTIAERNLATGGQMTHSRQRKTGFGVHFMLLHALTPRSCTGQIM